MATSNPAVDLSDIVTKLAPTLFGQKTSTSSTPTTIDPTQLAGSNDLINLLTQRGTSTAQADGVVQDILYRAQLAFAPVLGEEKGAGMYNSTTTKMMAQEAAARATAASAQAVLEDQQRALAQATSLRANNVKATTGESKVTNQKSQGKNILGTAAAGILLNKGIKKGGSIFDDVLSKIDAMGNSADASSIPSSAPDTNAAVDSAFGTGTTGDAVGTSQFVVPDEAAAIGTSLSGADASDLAGSTVSFGDSGAAADASVSDAASAVDAGAADAADAAGDAAPAIADNAGNAGSSVDISSFFDDVSDFFADGGLVTDRAGYTDDALAARGKLATPTNIVSPAAIGGLIKKASLKDSSSPSGLSDPSGDVNSYLNALMGGDASASPGPGASVGAPPGGLGLGLGIGNAVAGLAGNAVPGLGIAVAIGLALANSLGLDADNAANADATNAAAMADADSAESAANADAAPASTDGVAEGGNTASSAAAAAADAAAADAASSDSSSDGSTAGDSGDSAGDGGSGDGGGDGGEKEGGMIRGPGTGTSDSIPARLSTGEFVIPADVVSMVGVDKLQNLIDMFHTPANK